MRLCADEHDKKGAQIHYAFGSYSTRFEFDALGKKRGEVEPSPKLLPSDFDVKNPGLSSPHSNHMFQLSHSDLCACLLRRRCT